MQESPPVQGGRKVLHSPRPINLSVVWTALRVPLTRCWAPQSPEAPALGKLTSSSILGYLYMLYIELPCFPKGVICQRQKRLKETTDQNMFLTRTTHSSMCHLLGEFVLSHPKVTLLVHPGTKAPIPCSFPPLNAWPGFGLRLIGQCTLMKVVTADLVRYH